MDFAFDPAKSEANLRKHGIDVLAAQALWRVKAALEIQARTTHEPCFLVIPFSARSSLVSGESPLEDWSSARSPSADHDPRSCSSMNTSEFDRRFEAVDSLIDAPHLPVARRPRQEQQRVNVHFPV